MSETKQLTPDELRLRLRYEADSGHFYWRRKVNQVDITKPAGFLIKSGHIRIQFRGRMYLAHTLAWFYVTGQWPRHQIDHRNRVASDNRFENLREACQFSNAQNKIKNRRNTSGHVGVYLNNYGKWQAQIQFQGKNYGCGVFSSLEDAIQARRAMSLKLRGEFAPELNP